MYNIITGAATVVAVAAMALPDKVHAQAPALSFQRSMGGSSSEKAMSCQQATDGGYIVSGYSSSSNGDIVGAHGNTDAWVIKLTSTGTISWKYVFGGPGSESAQCIRQTSDGGYIFAGYCTMNGGDVLGNYGSNDFWVVKLNATGTAVWKRCYGGTGVENAYSIRETFDGGYIVAGFTGSTDVDVVTTNHGGNDAWLLKLNSAGIMEWSKTYGGIDNDYANDVVQTSDTGYLFTGYASSSGGDLTINHGMTDLWTVKTDKNGAIQWQKAMGGSDWEYGYSCLQMKDGTYAVAGIAYSSDGDVTTQKGNGDIWVIRYSATGSVLWQKTYGGSIEDEGRAVVETAGGGLCVSGTVGSADTNVSSNHGGADVWVVKLSATGAIQWEKTFGGSVADEGFALANTSDGGYLFAGASTSTDGDLTGNLGFSDLWVGKLAACSPPSPTISLSGTTLTTTVSFDTYQWKLAGAAITGATAAAYTATVSGDYSVDVTNNYGCGATSGVQHVDMPVTAVSELGTAAVAVYPNPVSGSFTAMLPASLGAGRAIVTDMMGRTVILTSFNAAQENKMNVDMSAVPTGHYMLVISANDTTYRTKIAVIK